MTSCSLKNQDLKLLPLDSNQTLSTHTLQSHLGGWVPAGSASLVLAIALHGLRLENSGRYPATNGVAETGLEGPTRLFDAASKSASHLGVTTGKN